MKKGSKAAKDHMAKLRAMRGKPKKKSSKKGKTVSFMSGGKRVSFKAKK